MRKPMKGKMKGMSKSKGKTKSMMPKSKVKRMGQRRIKTK